MPTLQTRTASPVVTLEGDDHVTALRKAAIKVRPKVGSNIGAALDKWLDKTAPSGERE